MTTATQAMIKCEIDGALVHSIQLHLNKAHPTWTVDKYRETYPGAPLLSALAEERIAKAKADKLAAAAAAGTAPVAEAAAAAPATVAAPATTASLIRRVPMHEVFGLADTKETRNSKGDLLQVEVRTPTDAAMVPDVDDNYIINAEFAKNILMALAINTPTYVWGHAGTGKTTGVEQVAARTGRELLRVQHTINMEESHVVGQWVAKDGATEFALGPLPTAMKNGWIYLADEYDFALPSVLSVYQSVLEGKNLVIKEADSANRIIRPHPNFRFIATGNTNGSGDETGLYQGTNIQNAANFDRFHMVLQVVYLEPKAEIEVVSKQAGIAAPDAKKLVDFANMVRESYTGGKISSPISPRTLIAAGRIGMMKANYRAGIQLAFSNKLSTVDKSVVDGLSQRIFG